MEWSKRQTLDLIQFMHSNECLWNMKNEEYKDRKKKKESLEYIARQMEISPIDIEKKITNLKNQYNRENHKIKKRSGCGTDDAYVSHWYAFRPLNFLKHNLPKSYRGTDFKTEEENYDVEINNDSITVEEQHMPSTLVVSEVSPIKEELHYSAKRFKPDRQQRTEHTEALSVIKEARDDIITRKINRINRKDELDVFGEFVASELRGIIGKKNILETKKQIQDLIYFKKLEQLNSAPRNVTQNIKYEDSDYLPSENSTNSFEPICVINEKNTEDNKNVILIPHK